MLDTSTIRLLSRSLDAASLRQRVIADNIANVDTPNYKSKGVSFEQELKQALDKNSASSLTFSEYRTDPRHLTFSGHRSLEISPRVYTNQGLFQNSKNNVDIDAEMTNMAQNQIWYNALVQQTTGYYDRLRKTINGGKG